MSYKKSNWVPYDSTLSFEQNVTQGGTTTADKLNNIENGIGNAFDKTSDTVGVRNYVLNSNVPITISDGGANNRFATIPTNLSNLQGNYIFNADVSGLVGGQTSLTIGLCNPTNNDDNILTDVPIVNGKVTKKFNITTADSTHTSLLIYSGAGSWNGSAGCTAIYNNYSFYKTDADITDWVPAPEDVNQQLDKKVNVSDMRKPASDVAGIEEVNALQTQVNNSAVGTNLLTNSNFSFGLRHWSVNQGTNADCKAVVTTDSDGDTCVHITGTGTSCGLYCWPVSFNQNQVTTGSVLVKGTGEINLVGLEHRPSSNFGTISTKSYSKIGSTTQAASSKNVFCIYFDAVDSVIDVYIKFAKLELGSHATDWCPNPDDKVNVADMRKPASDVAGIEEVNAKADDSKVAHLSGANNFDTTPTVNNKSVATTDDVSNASNTVLTSANTSISKLLQSSSNNDEDSAVTNSTSDTNNFYYWTE